MLSGMAMPSQFRLLAAIPEYVQELWGFYRIKPMDYPQCSPQGLALVWLNFSRRSSRGRARTWGKTEPKLRQSQMEEGRVKLMVD